MRLTNPLRQKIAKRAAQQRAALYREFIRREAAIGGQLFGPVPGHIKREFVCVNKHTWLWHEEWTDQQNIRHTSTTRYDIRPGGIYKMQDSRISQPISPQEARHLLGAAKLYHQQMQILYSKK